MSITHNPCAEDDGYLWQMGKKAGFVLCTNDSRISAIGAEGSLTTIGNFLYGYVVMGHLRKMIGNLVHGYVRRSQIHHAVR